ncbi:lysosomal Pro-X carboxypeptidase-like isoform X2 [Physella acuta]|uniref:lysosomal Pro-X carboxypeptidase-like isoform X2 n=1 Tax=Physella acuta TaxID=109671 RepID=UPI0027DB9A00|nr:lysosomal Pro-X carboxypeptidase-like isoform X2 [Physella acuta]
MEFSLKYCFLICELVVIFTNVESLHFGHTVSSAKKLLPLQEPYTYRTYYYDQQLDHLGFATMQKFKQRYLLADQFWNRNNGPIFFYTGNEGDIDWFCNNTGFMWDIAADFKALLVFAEHRYYGESLPFGPETYQNVSNLNYLTSEQALADFVELINYLKTNLPGAANSSVVAFGGSYGGMLAAWLRIKYPNVVVGALAASAPIWQFTNMTPCNAFYDTTSATWLQASATCVDNIHQSYNTIDMIASSGGYDFITSTFGLCTPLKSKYDLIPFVEFLNDMYVNFAMVNYPYPADFLAQLPAWPVKVACSFLNEPLQGKPLLVALSKVSNLYFNYTGSTKCVNWTSTDSTGSLGYKGWQYQRCTEMVMPICSNGTNMFCNIPWDLQQVSDNCYSQFKVRPRENWVALEYWAKELKTATNIIFSNGLYDPWSSGGVMQTLSDSLIAIQIPEGGHHLDLRGKHPLDTRAVINARLEETNIIRNWLKLTPVQ